MDFKFLNEEETQKIIENVESQFKIFWSSRKSELQNNSSNNKLQVPLKEIKNSIQEESNSEIHITKEAGQVLSKATELFIQQLSVKSLIYHSQTREDRLIQPKHLAFALSRTRCNDFFSDFFPRNLNYLFEEKNHLLDKTVRPSLLLGEWFVILKRFDENLDDILFPNDEDYYFQMGPQRSSFKFYLRPKNNDYELGGEFYLGFHQGIIQEGKRTQTLNSENLELEFKFQTTVRKGISHNLISGIGKSKLSNGKLHNIWLLYFLPNNQKLYYNYICSTESNEEVWKSLLNVFKPDDSPPFE